MSILVVCAITLAAMIFGYWLGLTRAAKTMDGKICIATDNVDVEDYMFLVLNEPVEKLKKQKYVQFETQIVSNRE